MRRRRIYSRQKRRASRRKPDVGAPATGRSHVGLTPRRSPINQFPCTFGSPGGGGTPGGGGKPFGGGPALGRPPLLRSSILDRASAALVGTSSSLLVINFFN